MAKHPKAYIALIFICIVWGTTFLAMKIGVSHYPAFLFAGVRQTSAGIILAVAALFVSKQKDLSTRNIFRQMLIGFLMLSIGNGCVTWGEKFIPSGIAALICSMMPLFAVTFNLFSSKKDHFNVTIGAGLLLGVCGVGMIFKHDVSAVKNPAYLGGIFATMLATCSWALGSIINKKHDNPVNPFFNSGLQLLFGGLFMLIISPVVDDYHGLVLWDTGGLLSLLYLVIFGSVLAYTAYMYAFTKLPVGIATIYSYINPLIAVIVGYLFRNEDLNIYTGLAFGTIVVSVYLMNIGYRKQHKTELKKMGHNTAAAFPENMPAES